MKKLGEFQSFKSLHILCSAVAIQIGQSLCY